MTERGILTGVAWADIIACAILRYLPAFLFGFAIGLLFWAVIRKCG